MYNFPFNNFCYECIAYSVIIKDSINLKTNVNNKLRLPQQIDLPF